MKKTSLLLLLFIIASNSITAQISPNVIKKFPAHIIYKMDEVTSKVSLPEDTQMKLGAEMLKKDSIANTLLAKGLPLANLKKQYDLDKKFLKQLLTLEEAETYFAKTDPNNRFLQALQLATNLKLTPTQITAIRQQNTLLDSLKIKGLFEKNEFYNRKLDTILAKKQYGMLISSLYKIESNAQSTKDWEKILKLKLATPKDSTMVLAQLNKYNLIKNSVLDPKSGRPQTKKISTLKDKIIIDFQPAILTHYYILKDEFYKINLFSEVIRLEKELNLTAVQTDSLLVNYKKIEQMKFKNKDNDTTDLTSKDYSNFQNVAVTRILEPKQLTQFFYKKNFLKAKKLAFKDWTQLEKQNKVADLDKNKTLTEFDEYHLKALIANERIKMNKNQLNIFIKRDIELKKPELLRNLDAQKQAENNAKSTKNELKW